MYVDELWVIVNKDSGKIVAGFGQNAYTSKGRAEAAIRKIHGSQTEKYRAAKVTKEE